MIVVKNSTRARFSGRECGVDDHRLIRFLSRSGEAKNHNTVNILDAPAGGGWGKGFKKRGRKMPPAVMPHVGLYWLQEFRDYDGLKCLIFPFRTTSSQTGTVTYNFRKMPSSRAMCFMANGSPPEGKTMALHRCGNGHLGCVNPTHLYWGDYSDNALDAKRHMVEGKVDCDATQTCPTKPWGY